MTEFLFLSEMPLYELSYFINTQDNSPCLISLWQVKLLLFVFHSPWFHLASNHRRLRRTRPSPLCSAYAGWVSVGCYRTAHGDRPPRVFCLWVKRLYTCLKETHHLSWISTKRVELWISLIKSPPLCSFPLEAAPHSISKAAVTQFEHTVVHMSTRSSCLNSCPRSSGQAALIRGKGQLINAHPSHLCVIFPFLLWSRYGFTVQGQ